MKGGFSGKTGIIFYDTGMEGANAVYGSYVKASAGDRNADGRLDSEKISLHVGTLDEIKELRRKDEETLKSVSLFKVFGAVFIMMVIGIILGFLKLGFLKGLLFLSYLAVIYVPISSLIYSYMDCHGGSEVGIQFRRFHGAEHAVKQLWNKEDITLEKVKKSSIYDAECGSAYYSMIIFLATLIGWLLLNIVEIGFIKFIVVIAITLILMVINLFNPYNPFLIFQRFTVARPTDREYLLAMETLKKFKNLEARKR